MTQKIPTAVRIISGAFALLALPATVFALVGGEGAELSRSMLLYLSPFTAFATLIFAYAAITGREPAFKIKRNAE